MEKLLYPGSNDEPFFNLDPETGILVLGGTSLPENVFEVYLPVVSWLDKYLEDPNPKTEVRFQYEYLNTASSQMIMQLLERFLRLKDVCESFSIKWYYEKTDLDMREFGEELAELTMFPLELVATEDM